MVNNKLGIFFDLSFMQWHTICIKKVWEQLTVSHCSKDLEHKARTSTNFQIRERVSTRLLVRQTLDISLYLSVKLNHMDWYNQTLGLQGTWAAKHNIKYIIIQQKSDSVWYQKVSKAYQVIEHNWNIL